MSVEKYTPNATTTLSTPVKVLESQRSDSPASTVENPIAKIGFVSLGCPKNLVDSERILTQLRTEGYDVVPTYNDADLVIVNTCGFIDSAVQESLDTIGEALTENGKVIVTGCLGIKEDEIREVHPNVLAITGPHAYESVVEQVHSHLPKPVHNPFEHLVPDHGIKLTPRHYAYLKISEGCNHRCTFCIIPYGRGNSRSVPIGEIAQQVRKLVDRGYKEIVFTGVDVTDYGLDLPGKPTLGQMIRRVLALVPELPRLRLSSIDPVEIDEDLWTLIAEEPRLMPHLHLSLQAGDDMVLKRMKRRHLRQDVIDCCKRARKLRPDVAFGADIIAGFPTETDAMFQNTLDIVEECDLTFLHVFPYSEREGTPAARMPQVQHAVRTERAAKLREAGENQLSKFLRNHINKTRQVVVEKEKYGHTEHFAPVVLDKAYDAGALLTVRVTGIENNKLTATEIWE